MERVARAAETVMVDDGGEGEAAEEVVGLAGVSISVKGSSRRLVTRTKGGDLPWTWTADR